MNIEHNLCFDGKPKKKGEYYSTKVRKTNDHHDEIENIIQLTRKRKTHHNERTSSRVCTGCGSVTED